jgi:hypothetical protein
MRRLVEVMVQELFDWFIILAEVRRRGKPSSPGTIY